MEQTPEREPLEQEARAQVRQFIARQLLLLSNDLRQTADRLCVAHLRYEPPTTTDR